MRKLDVMGGPKVSPEELAEELADSEEMSAYMDEITPLVLGKAEVSPTVEKLRKAIFGKTTVRTHLRGGEVVVQYSRSAPPKRGTVSPMTQHEHVTTGRNLAKVAQARPKGFTINSKGRLLEVGKDKGYVVATKDSKSLVVTKQEMADTSFPERLGKWVHEQRKGRSVGGWLDSETGKTAFDIVEVVSDRAKAIKMAQDRDEKAIFDLWTGEEIRVGGSGRGAFD